VTERLKSIEESPLYTAEEKEKGKSKAEETYRKKLQSFYHNKDRLKEIHEKYKDADMLLTKTERMSIYNYKLNNNTLILGGSGSGKTRGYVMPNILQAHSSFIVTDPKGEILEKAGHFLRNIKGYKIRVLNLDDKTKSDGYNPFVYIHPERQGYEERVLSLIEAIIINTDGGEKKGSSDPFWDKAERLFLQAVFFFTCDGFQDSERNMNTVLSLIGMLKIEEEQDNYDSDLDYFARIFEREHGSDHIGVQQFKEFREKASGKTAKSIVISTVARLAPFRTASIRKMFEYDSLCLDMVGEEKTAVFVVVPPTDSTFNFIAGMMFTQLFQELQYCATQVHKHDGQKLPVPCRFILDEFANTCTIPNFVKILAYARSFGIGIVPILQSLEQIKTMYEKEWGVIIDNCNSLLFLGSITHMDTLEYMSKLVGKGTFDKRTTGRSRGKQGSSSQNFDVIGRELMDASEIRKLPKENCLLVVGGKDAFYSDKFDYTTHPNYRYTSDGNHSYTFDFIPAGKPIDSEVAHGEQIADNIPLSPSENVIVEIEKITIDESLQNMVNRLGRTINRQIPVPDNELNVDDGESTELTTEQEIDLFDALMAEDEQNAKAAAKIMSDETQAYLTQLEQDKIAVVPPEQQIIPFVKSIAQQIPAPNEDLEVDDGEKSETEVTEFEEYIFDDATEDVADIEDLLGDVTDLINGIDNAVEFQSELAVVGTDNE
jgi:type IV secretion system protein VirD4